MIQERGYQLDLIRMLLDQSRKSIGISCFSNNFNNNMPMWAHYSNNHQGFCMEYQVKNSDLFYPVFYERKRIKTVSVFPDVISEIKNTLAGKKTKYKFELLMSIILLELCLKHNTWKYEQEYRILYPFSTQIERGQLLSNFELDIWPKVIYLGVKCSDEHKQELKRIAETLHCEIYEMYFDDYSADFELKYRAYLR